MHSPRIRIGLPALAVAILAAAALVAVAPAAEDNTYVVHNIISNVPGAADHPDANLENGWGLDRRPDLTLVGRRQRHRPFDAVHGRGGTKAGAEAVTVDGGPTGLVFILGVRQASSSTKGTMTERARQLPVRRARTT